MGAVTFNIKLCKLSHVFYRIRYSILVEKGESVALLEAKWGREVHAHIYSV
jgi:hypothetical protein